MCYLYFYNTYFDKEWLSFMQSNNQDLDFSDVLAAVVHDMKNSLGLVIQSIETLSHHVPSDVKSAHKHISRTHYEATRLNSNLVQLLSLYKNDIQGLYTNIDEYSITDIFEEIISSNDYYAKQNNISVSVEIDPHLHWFIDSELVYLLLNDALINAFRYGNSQVRIAACIQKQKNDNHDYLCITIEDDGLGYPVSMTEEKNGAPSKASLKHGRTGLGLFFARLIAEAHENNNKHGEISLTNGGTLGGSVFLVKLP